MTDAGLVILKRTIITAAVVFCYFAMNAHRSFADLGDGKPLTPSAITVTIESCYEAAPANGMEPAFQLAYCACIADYMDGLPAKELTAFAEAIRSGELSKSFVRAVKKCGRWANRGVISKLDRTPYSRRNILSSIRTKMAYRACSRTEVAREKGPKEAIAFCDRLVGSVRRD